MSKSIILIIVGVILIGIAFLTASSIPHGAYKDLLSNGEAVSHDGGFIGVPLDTMERENLFMQTHAHRRLLQNFYLGASGLICLAVGLLALSNKNNSQPIK